MRDSTKIFLQCESREDLASFLDVSISKLNYYAFSKKNKYIQFEIIKKNGAVRLISAPYFELKELQRKLKTCFDDIYNPPNSSYGFIKDKSYINNANHHLKQYAILNFDLKDFFPSIHSGRIYGLFKSKAFNFSDSVASALTGIVTYENHLPQGAPTSPVLSNMTVFKMDRDFMSMAKIDRLKYTRYCDDITFSSSSKKFPKGYYKINENEECFVDAKVNDIVKKNGFEINTKKNRFFGYNKPRYVTGVKINAKLNLNWGYIRQIRSMLYAWEKFGLERASDHFNNRYNNGIEKNFQEVVRGKIEYIRRIRTDIDPVYRKLYNRFVSLEGKGRQILPINEVEDLQLKIQVVSTKKQGTGFILRGCYLITCCHVLEGLSLGDSVDFFNYNNFAQAVRSHGKVILMNEKNDIGIISISRSAKLSFVESDQNLSFKVGDDFRAIGFPQYIAGKPPQTSFVKVSSQYENKFGINEVYVSNPMFAGMSGGPVIDENGKVVGMISRGTENTDTSNSTFGYIFIPIYYIQKELDAFEKSLD